MLFMDVFILFIGPDFREGASIIPLVLAANLLMGIFYNLSIWYKLSNKTIWGAYLVLIGASITFGLNYIFIPEYGYYASSLGRFVSYLVMVIISFWVGQKFYKVNYKVKKILLFVVLALLSYLLSFLIHFEIVLYKYILNFIILLFYCSIFYLIEIKKIFLNNESKNN
jgi:O-antigen/teichoic acid export membrane protein